MSFGEITEGRNSCRFEVLLAWDALQLGRLLRKLLACFEMLRRTGMGFYLTNSPRFRC